MSEGSQVSRRRKQLQDAQKIDAEFGTRAFAPAAPSPAAKLAVASTTSSTATASTEPSKAPATKALEDEDDMRLLSVLDSFIRIPGLHLHLDDELDSDGDEAPGNS